MKTLSPLSDGRWRYFDGRRRHILDDVRVHHTFDRYGGVPYLIGYRNGREVCLDLLTGEEYRRLMEVVSRRE